MRALLQSLDLAADLAEAIAGLLEEVAKVKLFGLLAAAARK